MSELFSIKVDTSLLGAEQDSARAAEAVRPAAQAGAQVLYNAVVANVAALGRKTGNLARSIYQAHSEDNSWYGNHTYHVSWNARKAPHGHLVEFGYVARFERYIGSDGHWYTRKDALLATPRHVGAMAPVRRAASKMPQALQAMEDEYFARLGITQR